jgi:hypothetical protein
MQERRSEPHHGWLGGKINKEKTKKWGQLNNG